MYVFSYFFDVLAQLARWPGRTDFFGQLFSETDILFVFGTEILG